MPTQLDSEYSDSVDQQLREAIRRMIQYYDHQMFFGIPPGPPKEDMFDPKPVEIDLP